MTEYKKLKMNTNIKIKMYEMNKIEMKQQMQII